MRRTRRQRKATKLDTFASRYTMGEKLGEGSFGSVFKGQRVSDGLQVAIKFVRKLHVSIFLQADEIKVMPVEVALLQIRSQTPICKTVIQLIEWFDELDRYILVLERPDPCKSLDSFLQDCGGYVTEDMVQNLMWQSVMAAFQCRRQGVLHWEIKPENLLINQDTLEVKLIDFGCGDFIKKYGYNIFEGTDEYCPSEFILDGRYHAGPASVWSLGVLMFRMVCRYLPFTNDDDITGGGLHFRDGLSDGETNESILVNNCENDSCSYL
ncbi:serine/threonine-protein kinase pim-1-like [Pygocentrus nattereri]|uniref:serine/threonine-protein kinase pim-1-like n=1 Tax=Pygocentrus nattereri TaxID=42514 RepID=UPI0018915EF2|nr:serine/threonine-protein kinase pim-1-like [Pygocentrus nattereri]